MNLAALECVDYVIIDENATPIENLKVIQPDYFAKGYEYSAEGIHPKTREEMAAIDSYGGQILFTPGDLVLSSSAIIETTPPNLAMEKLLALLHSENLEFNDLRGALTKLAGRQGPCRRRHHRGLLHLLLADRRHGQDTHVQRETRAAG